MAAWNGKFSMNSLPMWSCQFQVGSKLAVRTRKDVEAELISLALRDESARFGLLEDPKAAIEKLLGTRLPYNLRVDAIQETDSNIVLVLPWNPYEGMTEGEFREATGTTFEDVARLVLGSRRDGLIDEEASVNLVARFWRDAAFRQALLDDPAAVLREEFGFDLEPGLQVAAIAEGERSITIVVPHLQYAEFEALIAAEIEGELQVNILATVCDASFADPCGTNGPTYH